MHSLEQRIAVLRTRARRLVWVRGVSWVVAGALAAIVVLGWTDYLLNLVNFRVPGLRLLSTAALLGVLAWMLYRYLGRPLLTRLRDVDVALRLERRFPELQGRLASSVEFLRQPEDEPLAGSAALRRAVIAQTAAEADRLDFSEALNTRPTMRAALTAVCVCLLAAILLAADYTKACIALERLVNPFGGADWPQQHYLQLTQQKTSVGRGQTFEVEVTAAEGTELPDEVWIHYRTQDADGTVTDESRLMQPVEGAAEPTVAAARENVIRPFFYRVTGGDDDSMLPIRVEVVEPPRIHRLVVRLTPPHYTGWPVLDAGRQIRALVGTRMAIEAETTKPLRSAVLWIEIDGQKKRLPAVLRADGYGFTLSADKTPDDCTPDDCAPDDAPDLVIRRPEHSDGYTYGFELVDRDDDHVEGGSDFRGEIFAVADAPPTVAVGHPPTGERLFVTVQAIVPIRAAADDDLAVRDVWLQFGPPEATPADPTGVPTGRKLVFPDALPLGPFPPGPKPAAWFPAESEAGARRAIEYGWELGEVAGLAPGMQITFRVEASDYCGQTGRSETRELLIISDEELQNRIATGQTRIIAELTRALRVQNESHGKVQALLTRIAEMECLRESDADVLQAAELNQSQVDAGLTEPSSGVRGQIAVLLADLDNNRLESPDVRRHVHVLLGELDHIAGGDLPAAGRELTVAAKATRVRIEQLPPLPLGSPPQNRPLGPDPASTAALAAADAHQAAVIASLEQVLSELKQWDNYRRFYRRVSQLLKDQQDAADRTGQLGGDTAAMPWADLSPPQRADLKVLGGRQRELAHQFDRVLWEMADAIGPLESDDPLAAQTIADAAAEAARLAIAQRMRQCGQQIDRNLIYAATGQQQQIIRDLQEVLDVLANRRQHELARLVEKLTKAEGDLADIERQQDGLRKQIQAASQEPDEATRTQQLQRLSRQQRQLQQKTEEMARRLARLMADRAGRTAKRAAQSMGNAADAAGAGDNRQAAENANDAQQVLKLAREQLAERRFQAQLELAAETLARLEDEVKHLHRRQQKVLEETRRYAALKDSGELSHAQSGGLLAVAREQRALESEVSSLASGLGDGGAFRLALGSAAVDMARAAGRLERQLTDAVTLQAAHSALRRLALLLEALEPERPLPSDGGTGGPNGGDGGGLGGGEMPGGVQTVTELKLLKLMQHDLRLRTEALDAQTAPLDTLNAEHRRQYQELSREQGRLAVLVFQLLQVDTTAPEDDPGTLPDLRVDPANDPELLPLEEELP